jgi:hypothetical protein
LKALIAVEDKIKNLARATVERSGVVRGIAERVLAEEAVSYILHMEMRVNEKLFWTLLNVGMDRYQDGDSATRRLLVSKVTECMKTTVLGNLANEREYQWKFPLKDSGKRVDPRSMTNVHSRRCVMGVKTLTTIMFSPDLDEKNNNPLTTRQWNARKQVEWESLMDTYLPMMSQIRKHGDFTASEIDDLHKLTFTFM